MRHIAIFSALLFFGLMFGCMKEQEPDISEAEKSIEPDAKKADTSEADTAGPDRPALDEKPEKAAEVIIRPEDFIIEVPGQVYFVSPDGLESNKGTHDSPLSLEKANSSVQPGDAVILMDGTYNTSIRPQRSGEKGKPIIYRAVNSHKAVLTRTEGDKSDPEQFGHLYGAVILSDRSYITIEGIKVIDVFRFILALNAHHVTINGCYFENAAGWQSCRFRNMGDKLCFTNNFLNNGSDLISIKGGNNHLVEGNTINSASHTGLVLLGVQRSVIRNNLFTNPLWKCMEVFSTRKSPERLSMYNLLEGNRFDYSPSSSIQYAGSRSILRKNIFRMCRAGMNWANYKGSAHTPEAWNNHSNRFYNNVIAECGPSEKNNKEIRRREQEGIKPNEPMDKGGTSMAGMTFSTNMPSYAYYYDQKIVNNIFYRNYTRAGDAPAETVQMVFDWNADPIDKLTRGLNGETQSIFKHSSKIPYYGNEYGSDSYPSKQLCYLLNNIILCEEPGQKVIWWCDAKEQDPPLEQNFTLKEFEARFPSVASGNIEADPLFVDIDGGDFRLRENSPCIDAGTNLTRTITFSEKTTIINVGDASWFTDGYGIIEPDVIRVGDERVRIVRIDYDNNEITVERALSWGNWVPVNLDYKGSGPDMGAYEFEGSSSMAYERSSSQKSVLRRFTFESGVSAYFQNGVVSSEKAYSGNYSLKAEKAPKGKSYDSWIKMRWLRGGVCAIPKEKAYIDFAYYAPVDGEFSIGLEGSTVKNRKYSEFLAKKEIKVKKGQWNLVSLPIKEFKKGSEVLGRSWSWFYIQFKNGTKSPFYVDDISLVYKGEAKLKQRDTLPENADKSGAKAGGSKTVIIKQWDFEKGGNKGFSSGTVSDEKVWKGSSSFKAALAPEGKWYQREIRTPWTKDGICAIPDKNAHVNFAYFATSPCSYAIYIEGMPGEITAKIEFNAVPGSWQTVSIPFKKMKKGAEIEGKSMSRFLIRIGDTDEECEFYIDSLSISSGPLTLSK